MTDQEQNDALNQQWLECRKSLQTYEARKANPAATAEELLAPVIASEVRVERNKRLAECDWTQLTDAPLDLDGKSAWALYREALRMVPEQQGFPWEVVWPEQP
jgi:hypothetical protein